MISFILFAAVAGSCLCAATDNNKPRAALVVTLAGDHKLTEYFEWSCRTIGASSSLFDMLIFHEANVKLQNVICADNVKFIDLGAQGMSKHIVQTILTDSNPSELTRNELLMMVNNIVVHSPRYLVEIKPMLGTILADHLTDYTHWSYTDPDIVWGNLADWVDTKDMEHFDVLTFAKNMDAGRLFLRGQFALHKNTAQMNSLWKKLEYFSPANYAARVGSAYRMLMERRPTDAVFQQNFHSAEGWYSQLVFRQPGIKVKIVGRGFDDFFREPVVLHGGRLSRCALTSTLGDCIANSTATAGEQTGVSKLPPVQLVPAAAYHDPQYCRMFWLPTETRYCLMTESYDKEAALVQQDRPSRRKLQRAGEAVLEGGQWRVNDEMASRRQTLESAALFHFRHWDDFLRTSISTSWDSESGGIGGAGNIGCMVLFMRSDRALAFESCASVATKEAQNGQHAVQLETLSESDATSKGKHGKGSSKRSKHAAQQQDVSKLLSQRRKESEVGVFQGGGKKSGGGHSAHKSDKHHHHEKKKKEGGGGGGEGIKKEKKSHLRHKATD